MVTNKAALEHIVTIVENNQASLTVVNVVESITSSDLQSEISNTHEQKIESLVDPYRKRLPVQVKILKGIPFMEIIHLSPFSNCMNDHWGSAFKAFVTWGNLAFPPAWRT